MLDAARIILARKREGWTQEELARRIGTSEREVQRWEAGEAVPKGMNRLALMRELRIYGFTSKQETPPMSEKQDTPHTYFVQSREDYKRLMPQGHMTTLMLGGAMPEQADPSAFHRVLDVGCGAGGWLIDCARLYPLMHTLEGVDISSETVAFARSQAEQAGVSDRVHVQKMDVLTEGIAYPNGYFDLVNIRYAVGWMRIWDWAKLILEMRRVLREEGIVRFVEAQYIQTELQWLSRYWDMGRTVARNASYLRKDISHITELLPEYLRAAQFSEVQSFVKEAVYQYGTPEHALFIENQRKLLPGLEAYLRKWTNLDAYLHEWHVSNYQQLVKNIIHEMESEGSSWSQPIETVCGKK